MSLQEWLNNGWLIAHKTSPHEIADLLAIADRDLTDADVAGLSTDWRFNIAYNAMLQTSTAALAAAGFRAAREAHHFRIIQSLQYTINADLKTITLLDMFRKKRNNGEYERAGAISDREAGEMIDAARQIRKNVSNYLQENYPHLIDASHSG